MWISSFCQIRKYHPLCIEQLYSRPHNPYPFSVFLFFFLFLYFISYVSDVFSLPPFTPTSRLSLYFLSFYRPVLACACHVIIAWGLHDATRSVIRFCLRHFHRMKQLAAHKNIYCVY